jgi:hypothetical protein
VTAVLRSTRHRRDRMRSTDQYKEWARIGAAVRLAQLDAERDGIFGAFPDLRNGRATAAHTAPDAAPDDSPY